MVRWGVLLSLFLALVGLDSGSEGSRVSTTEPRTGKCPVAISYHMYDVTGRTLEEVRAALLATGPRDDTGNRRFAYAAWHIAWEWPKDAAGKRDFSRTQMTCSADLTLPRYRPHPEVTEPELKKILSVMERLRAHEFNHLSHAEYGGAMIASKIHAAAKRGRIPHERAANKIAFRILDTLRSYDREYDWRTHFGESEGVWGRGGGRPLN